MDCSRLHRYLELPCERAARRGAWRSLKVASAIVARSRPASHRAMVLSPRKGIADNPTPRVSFEPALASLLFAPAFPVLSFLFDPDLPRVFSARLMPLAAGLSAQLLLYCCAVTSYGTVRKPWSVGDLGNGAGNLAYVSE